MAFTVTTSSSKIDVTGGSGDLDDLVTAVSDAGIMTNVGLDYVIKGTRELELSSGVTLTIGAAFEDGSLEWDSANSGTALEIVSGATLTCTAPGFTFNFDGNNGSYRYMYIYGSCTLTGTVAKPIIIKRYYMVRCYSYGQTISFDYVNFQDPSSYSTSNYALYFMESTYGSYPQAGEWSFTNITLDNRTNSGYVLGATHGDWRNVVIDSWTTTDTNYGVRLFGGVLKITNCTFNNIYRYQTMYSAGAVPMYYDSSVDSDEAFKDSYQPKITFDTCTFQDCYDQSSTEIGFYITYTSVIKFKNCSFIGVDDTMRYGISSLYNSRILLEGGQAGQTWTNVTDNLYYGSKRTYYDVYSLDLTVEDADGSPIENAMVILWQKEGLGSPEIFRTDASGNIFDLYGDLPVFVYRENYTNDSTFNYWADGTSDQVYIMHIVKQDYTTDTRELTFAANQTITAVLTANPTATTIIDSTLYDSTIY